MSKSIFQAAKKHNDDKHISGPRADISRQVDYFSPTTVVMFH